MEDITIRGSVFGTLGIHTVSQKTSPTFSTVAWKAINRF